jgi:hypothetical protein
MFTIIGFAAVALVGWSAARRQPSDSDDPDINAKQTRQDLRFIAYLLCAVVVMLGVVADRIH